MAPLSQPMYAKDEKALCFHGELLYEAKVLESKPMDPNDKKSAYQYRVHYKGWKNTWDDWVPQDRLRKLTDENRELAQNLKKELDALRDRGKPAASHKKKDRSARDSEERQSVAAAGSRGTKRAREYEATEKEESYLSRPSVRIHVPDDLKSLLVDDWENVTRNLQLVNLPSKTPAGIILDEYYEQEKVKRREGSAEYDILEEVIQGVKEYFNKCLGRILLYRFERQQYHEILSRIDNPADDLAGKNLMDIYGGEHLLRLFVTMPELIAQTNMDQQGVSRLREEIGRILLWLSKPQTIKKYFSVEYENVGSDYQDKAKGES